MLGERLVHVRYLYDDEVSFETNEELHVGMKWSHKLQKGYGSAWRHVVCKNDCPEAQEVKKCTTSEGEVFWKHPHHVCEYELGYETPEPDGIYEEWSHTGHETMRLSILRSCRQIYVEANNILWTANTFSFADGTAFRRFMMTRTVYQKRLIKSLRLQMDWVLYGELEWNKALTMALVPSLSALRHLRLKIEHKMSVEIHEYAKNHNGLYNTVYTEGLKRLSTLPLNEVEIVVETPKYFSEDHLWTKEDRDGFAEGLREILLNPKGAQIYAEDQLKRKERSRRDKEFWANIKASMSRPKLEAQSESMADPPLARPSE